ncbi:hypothetical protein [uncultured Algibacter sp.]|uniref:hypothetical protein n=1 Tax=uncultured Algibacter sp. TaxID=298659 RepID=UPI0032170208
MENFYFLFEDLGNWDVWVDKGYSAGFIILLTTSLIINAIYYIVLGRKSMRFSTMGKWFMFGFINFALIFLITLVVEGITIFDLAFGEFHYEIWLFTIINAFYGFVLYTVLSLLFKRFSIFSKFIPVKF